MRLHHSLRHALNGIIYTFTHHPNIRIHFTAGLTALIIGYFLHLSHLELIVILFTITLVITAEMVNTAVESMVDLITDSYHLEAKIAKDVAAGMVLITAILSVIVGTIVFWPHLISII
jgi:diacylglycerol kinase (ATP)